jgi:hypothetical protein
MHPKASKYDFLEQKSRYLLGTIFCRENPFKARVQHLIGVVEYGFLEVVQPFICTDIERNNNTFLKEFGTHPKAAKYDFLAQKSRYLLGTIFCRENPYSLYRNWHKNRGPYSSVLLGTFSKERERFSR